MVSYEPQKPLVHLTSTSYKWLVTLATGNQSYKGLFSFLFMKFDISIWSASASLSCGTEYITAHSGVMRAIHYHTENNHGSRDGSPIRKWED